MDTALHRDFREFLKSLTQEGVEFLVIGGYAVIAHGYFRSTGDLDVWVRISDENARRLVEALGKFGFASPDLTPASFLTKGAIVRMGRIPHRIEILNDIAGVDFNECYPRRLRGRLDDLEVPLIALDDLKRNKKAAGRHKDLTDVEELSCPTARERKARKRNAPRKRR